MVSMTQLWTILHGEFLAENFQEQNWYKPQPGEPYRPLIAIPKQIQKINSFFEGCRDDFFTGFDPPRSLSRATALVPTTTTGDSKIFTTAPKPSPTLDAGAKKTTDSKISKSTPAKTPAVGQAQKSTSQALDPKHKLFDPETEPKDPKPLESSLAQPPLNPKETSSDPQHENNANGVPGKEKKPKPLKTLTETMVSVTAIGGSDQNTDPAVRNIPAPASNANTIEGEPVKVHGQAKPVDPQQEKNAAETIGDPRKESSSKPNPSIETNIAPETGEDPAQETEPGKLDESPQSEIAMSNFNLLSVSPDQISRIRGAPSPSSQQSQSWPTFAHKENATPNQRGSQGGFRGFSHILQIESRFGSLSSRVPDPQNYLIPSHSITVVPTAAAVTSRTALSPGPPKVSMSSDWGKAPKTRAVLVHSEKSSFGDAITTAGFGTEHTNSPSSTRFNSSKGIVNKNMSTEFTGKAESLKNGLKCVIMTVLTCVWMIRW
ncbi:MAG: hypothetical protein ASARMPRED_006756 [Alectoria sarmentosa]|nr:MAG: hypothetical protein ASARMPRED_006756 [Alectoria sarmentosa]